jgi:hypothetical protein
MHFRKIAIVIGIVVGLISYSHCEASTYSFDGVSPLLSTQWGERGTFAKYAPNNDRVGCWSTALAQILHYHKLLPHGQVTYRCSNGLRVKEDLDQHRFDMPQLTHSPDEIARYLYAVSVVIQKYFGTGYYCVGHKQRAALIEQHFKCEAIYTATSNLSQLHRMLQSELDAHRPVMMHLRNQGRDKFHAVVVDGYETKGTRLRYHLNMGHEGQGDGWYRLDKAVEKYNDTNYHSIITVKPILSK